ncbi:MAG TPA: hypothetical protein PKO40_09565 [Dokdonella sp.]|uniref:hypothetical protein n=1 Tax=Dokdonella sp. TaxID=2291710 RepID=UPI002B9FE23C|nr:hypothetical protein [Dokdonella sp.]HNV08734.1 hypothetical protein [Dokdonella sp.]HPW03220.1 hypothetical protein [Dokdonella sp.]
MGRLTGQARNVSASWASFRTNLPDALDGTHFHGKSFSAGQLRHSQQISLAIRIHIHCRQFAGIAKLVLRRRASISGQEVLQANATSRVDLGAICAIAQIEAQHPKAFRGPGNDKVLKSISIDVHPSVDVISARGAIVEVWVVVSQADLRACLDCRCVRAGIGDSNSGNTAGQQVCRTCVDQMEIGVSIAIEVGNMVDIRLRKAGGLAVSHSRQTDYQGLRLVADCATHGKQAGNIIPVEKHTVLGPKSIAAAGLWLNCEDVGSAVSIPIRCQNLLACSKCHVRQGYVGRHFAKWIAICGRASRDAIVVPYTECHVRTVQLG